MKWMKIKSDAEKTKGYSSVQSSEASSGIAARESLTPLF
jgi:hypothetical protein